MNQGYLYTDIIPASGTGLPVVDFYALQYPHTGPLDWRQRIASGQILHNGRPAEAEAVLACGDRLEYCRPPWEEPAAPLHFDVLYEDPDVLALAKPSGLPVLPGGGFLENTLLHVVRQRYGPLCSPLHRLGRGTSGAILFTRNLRAARSLGAAMAQRRIRKVYLALAEGTGMPDRFTIEAPVGPVPHGPHHTVHAFSPAGRPSTSLVRVLRRHPEENTTLLEVIIPTGRPHQIRIHLSYAGYPLAGDPLYEAGGLPRAAGTGAKDAARPGDTGYHLHSWKIRFPRPATGQELEVVCPPPSVLDPAEGGKP